MQQGLSQLTFSSRGEDKKQEFSFVSIIKYLVNEYKVDPNTFLYDWKYDTTEKHSIMVQVYIDLGNYLSGKRR